MLSHALPVRKAHVTVRQDGTLYRWYRHTGILGYTSRDAFLTPAAATEAGHVVARCYGVPFRAVSWNSSTRSLTAEVRNGN